MGGITKTDLIGELHERGVDFRESEPKETLQGKLEDALHGIHHLPALAFDSLSTDLGQISLGSYEILPVEPLHTIAGHIKNLYSEIPFHLTKPEKLVFNETIKSSFSGREVKRAADYRQSLIDSVMFLKGKINPEVCELLCQLCEIQEILYADEWLRTPQKILRLHNLVFLHAVTMQNLLGTGKSLTTRKLFGQYYHALINHSPHQFRIMSLISSNTEDEERAFNVLKEISTNTSNHHPDNVLLNAFIRLQVRDDSNQNLTSRKNEIKNRISKHGKMLQSTRKNSCIKFNILKKYPRAWQAHLERTADFLKIAGVWEETDEGILFHDNDETVVFNYVHHFRSSTLAKETRYISYILCQ